MNINDKLFFINTKRWIVLISILILELVIAYIIPPKILTNIPLLASLVNIFQYVVPVLGKVNYETAENPEAVRFYIFITLCILPIKVWLFFCWLNSDKVGIYRFLVISPLTHQKPSDGDKFITYPLRQKEQKLPNNKPRSMVSRLIWSTLVLLFTFAFCWVFLDYGSNDPSSRLYKNYQSLVAEGFEMWMQWTVESILLMSFMLAVSICILRDYKIYFKQLYQRINGEGHE